MGKGRTKLFSQRMTNLGLEIDGVLRDLREQLKTYATQNKVLADRAARLEQTNRELRQKLESVEEELKFVAEERDNLLLVQSSRIVV